MVGTGVTGKDGRETRPDPPVMETRLSARPFSKTLRPTAQLDRGLVARSQVLSSLVLVPRTAIASQSIKAVTDDPRGPLRQWRPPVGLTPAGDRRPRPYSRTAIGAPPQRPAI